MKKLIFTTLVTLIIGFSFSSCSNESDVMEPIIELDFEAYGNHFQEMYNKAEDQYYPNVLELKANIKEWNTWDDSSKDSPYYDVESEVYITYYGWDKTLVNKPYINVSYGSGSISITGGITGPIEYMKFDVGVKDVILQDGEPEVMTGYFKSPEDFYFERTIMYDEGKYIQIAVPL